MNKATLFIIITILSSGVSCSQTFDKPEKLVEYNKIADSLVSSALSERKGYSWLKELCEFGPRLSGSKNLDKAVEWAKNKIESLGYDVWMQPVIVPHWERGNVESAEISVSKEFKGRKLSVAALGGSIATAGDGITAEVLEVQSIDELKQRQDEAKGKIIFFSRPLNPEMVSTFSAYGQAVDQRSIGAIEAARYGGVASIVRSITTKYDNVPHVGAIRKYDPKITAIPAAAIGYLDADFLSSAIKKDPRLKVTLILNCNTYPDVQSYNIITEIKGSRYPDEYVVVAGHFDSWDKGDGAHDDGGGCMQALEVLDLFSRFNLKPSRTIRCIFYANEENGIRGAIAYGNYTDSLKINHIAAIESDRGVFTPRGFTFEIDSLKRESVMKKVSGWLPILKKAGINLLEPGHGGVDISKIKNARALIGFNPDEQRYFDLHHSDNDTFDAVSPREMELGSAAIAILAYLISEEGL